MELTAFRSDIFLSSELLFAAVPINILSEVNNIAASAV